MGAAQTRVGWAAPLIVVGIMLVQVVTHLAWLPISTTVGQLAVPWLMSRGLTLFDTILENRPPATGVLLAALFRLLPSIEPILLVRALNLTVILALTMLIYALAKRLTGSTFAGLVAVIFWVLFEPVYGNLLFYFDMLVGLLLLLAALIATNSQRATAIALCGLLIGLATLFKQPAWAAVILFGLWLMVQRRWRDLIVFACSALVFPLLTMVIVTLQGNLESYLFWNFGRYLANSPGGQPLTGNIVRKLLFTDMLAPAFVLLALKQPAETRRRWLLVVALWLSGIVNMLPNFSEIYVMAHLPLLSVMSGVVIAQLPRITPRDWLERTSSVELTLVGVALAVLVGWAWIVVTPYAPIALGRASIPAYDEFIPLASRINALKQPSDTLYILPILDGNPQLFEMTDMLPPKSLIFGNSVFVAVPGITDRLLGEWSAEPPDIFVVFPDLLTLSVPWIDPLTAFVEARYEEIERIEDVPFNGDALIYRLKPGS
jgi:hypothetical protein